VNDFLSRHIGEADIFEFDIAGECFRKGFTASVFTFLIKNSEDPFRAVIRSP